MATMSSECPNCHKDYIKENSWPALYKCKVCGTVFCDNCSVNLICPKCKAAPDKVAIIQSDSLKTPDDMMKKAVAEAKARQIPL